MTYCRSRESETIDENREFGGGGWIVELFTVEISPIPNDRDSLKVAGPAPRIHRLLLPMPSECHM